MLYWNAASGQEGTGLAPLAFMVLIRPDSLSLITLHAYV